MFPLFFILGCDSLLAASVPLDSYEIPEYVFEEWEPVRQDPLYDDCRESVLETRKIVVDDTTRLCMSASYACLLRFDMPVIVLWRPYLHQENRLILHELIHHMSRCDSGNADVGHANPEFWAPHEESFEVRAQKELGI